MKTPLIFDKSLRKFMDNNLTREHEMMSSPDEIGALALTFWKYLRQMDSSDVQERRRRILSLIANELEIMPHQMVKLVAMIESLPTSVWRQLLWKENIDFVSFESFLRRLNSQQKEAIIKNYTRLFDSSSPQLPPVLKKGLRNRLKILFGKVSVKKLYQEEYNYEQRHQSKGAWAFNLLGLDFGFSLYPKGENDDTKISNQSFTRFLSIKEHINDFIVNQEYGKYWWLYRKARSNYAFSPNKNVQLKSHICPGFWATLFTHLVFWVLSPIGFISTGIWLANQSGYIGLMPLILSLPMILWLFVAFIRLLIKGVDKMPKKLRIIPKVIGVTILAAVILFASGVVIIFLGEITGFMVPIIGLLLSVMLVLTLIFYIIWFCAVIANDSRHSYSDVPKIIRFGLHVSLAATAIVLFDKYLADLIIAAIISFATGLWDWYTSNLFLSNGFILMLVLTTGLSYFLYLFLNNEERFVRHQKLLLWIIKSFFALSLIVFAYLFFQNGVVGLLSDSLLPGLALAVILMLIGGSLVIIGQANPDTIEDRSKIADIIFRVHYDISGLVSKRYINRILKSEWLWKMEESERWNIANDIIDLSFVLFASGKKRLALIDFLVIKGSAQLVDMIVQSRDDIRDFAYRNETMAIIELMQAGKTFTEAQLEIRQKRSAQLRFKAKLEAFLRMIARPFVLTGRGIAWLFKMIRRFFWTLQDIWSLFNERCPYVSRPKMLR